MNRKLIRIGWIRPWLLAGLLGSAGIGMAAEPSRPPNIVLIVADDLGWNAVSYHNGFVRTPHIDRIARSGVELDRFYVSPMCSPTRAALMSGRYPIRFGMGRTVVRPWARYGLPPEEVTLAEALRDAGYEQRGAFGKWHLGHLEAKWHPLSQGFTHFTGCYNGAADYWTRDRMGQVDWHVNANPQNVKGYTTDLIAEAATSFIRQAAGPKPFLCYVAFTAPHDPLQAPKSYIDRYAHLGPHSGDGKPSRKQILAGMIACLDDAIGRILQAIADKGIADQTLIWFVSDNGGARGIPGNNDPLRGMKLTVYEGGIRVPAAVWWPGVIEGGRKVTVPLSQVDVLPTLLRAAGADPLPRDLDGHDVFDILTGRKDGGDLKRDLYAFTAHDGPEAEQLAILSADGWKLVIRGPDICLPGGFKTSSHQVELFHLDKDPLEQHDLAAQEPARVAALAAKLLKFRQSEPPNPLPRMQHPPEDFRPPPNWKNDLGT